MKLMTFERWTRRIETFFSQTDCKENGRTQKRAAWFFIALLAVYSIARGLVAASARPLWFDELLTLTIASQPNLRDMWSAMTRGFDSQPPPFYLLERICLALPVTKQVALRLPSILAFPFFLLFVFTYVRKRSGELIACLCAVVFFSTSLFQTYQTEARGYSMMMACIVLALVCYQRLPSTRWTVFLGISLTLAGSFHYFAVFATIPFGLAEAVLTLATRRVRWYVWGALASGVLPLMICWPLLRAMKTFYGPHAYARVVFSQVSQAFGYYGSYFLTDYKVGLGLAAVSIAAIIGSVLRRKWALHQRTEDKAVDFAEGTLLLALNVLPLIVFVLMCLTHGLMLDRHALPATVGVALGVARAIYIVGPEGIVLFFILLFPGLAVQENNFWRQGSVQGLHELSVRSNAEFGQIQDFIQSGGYPDLPVVVNQGMVYFQIVHYSPPEWTKRLVYLTDSEKELTFEGADTIVKAMLGVRDFSPVQLVSYEEFTKTQRRFLVYCDGPGWILKNLSRDAASVRLLKLDKGRKLLLMQMSRSPE
jgi:4-amino-4-deoxy-L-arabinose transferase and related glycosyltransferases of PMT family